MSLSPGARSDAVRILQIRLGELGYLSPIDADSVYGAKTAAAVRAFQEDRGLKVDGIVGPVTMRALDPGAVPVHTSTVRLPSGARVPQERCFPLRLLADGRRPTVTSRHSLRNPSRPNHNGVDLLYPYKPGDPAMKIGDSGRTERWWIPDGTSAIAAAAGTVVFAGNSATGWRVWLKHDGDVATGYFHLSRLAEGIVPGRVVFAADDLGTVGDSPRGDDPDHLHFECYRGDIEDDVKHGRYPRGTIDPEPWFVGAALLPAV